MAVDYILTVFSLGMLGQRATAYVRLVSYDEALSLVDDRTQILAPRQPHQNLALNQFPQADRRVLRRVELRPGSSAILLQYMGPPMDMDGGLPPGAVVSYYLVEVEEYQEPS